MELVKRHTEEEWIILYIKRWLTAPFQMEDGEIIPRASETPQGGVISPVIANLFLHYTFDDFMVKQFPTISWERYADDGVTHCTSLKLIIKPSKTSIKTLIRKCSSIILKEGKAVTQRFKYRMMILGYSYMGIHYHD